MIEQQSFPIWSVDDCYVIIIINVSLKSSRFKSNHTHTYTIFIFFGTLTFEYIYQTEEKEKLSQNIVHFFFEYDAVKTKWTICQQKKNIHIHCFYDDDDDDGQIKML